jgi:hypothetical protein
MEAQLLGAGKERHCEDAARFLSSGHSQPGAGMDGAADRAGAAGRHWRGELGLTPALWRPAALCAAMLAVCAVLIGWSLPLLPPKPAFFLGLALWTAALAAAAWFCFGLFRAGLGHGRRGGSRVLGYGVAAVAAAGVIAAASLGTGLARTSMGRALERVQANLPTTVPIVAINNGTELVFDGDIEFGAAKALREAAARHPRVTRIRLGGMGGELGEARAMRDFIAEKGWDTYSETICWSGCAIAYLGGRHRTIGPQAQMGFHSASVWPLRDDERERAINEQIAREMIDRGIDPAFAREAWRKRPEGMWFPSHDELVRSGLVHAVTGP